MNNKKCIDAHDDWASNYDNYDTKPYFQFLTDIINHQVKKYIPKKGKILDAAGGTGTNAISLAKKGYDVVMTELSEKMISVAKTKKDSNKIHIIKSDLTSMHEFQNGEFDFTMCVGNAVSYCNSLKALSEMKRVSKEGSYIIFDVHSFYDLQKKCIKKADYKELRRLEKTHLFFNSTYDEYGFTIEEIEKLVSESGLELIEIFGKMVLPNIQNTDRMNELLSDKDFYKKLFKSELQVLYKKEYLACALELGVVCRVK